MKEPIEAHRDNAALLHASLLTSSRASLTTETFIKLVTMLSPALETTPAQAAARPMEADGLEVFQVFGGLAKRYVVSFRKRIPRDRTLEPIFFTLAVADRADLCP